MNTPEDNHERNQRALAYLDALKARQERQERIRLRCLGCVAVLVFNVLFWLIIYCFIMQLSAAL